MMQCYHYKIPRKKWPVKYVVYKCFTEIRGSSAQPSIWRYFSHRNTKRYIDVLQKIVYAYNQTLHSGMRMWPTEVNLYNAARVRESLDKRTRSNYRSRHRTLPHYKFDVGDIVHVSPTKGTFERGYKKKFQRGDFQDNTRITATRTVHIRIGGFERGNNRRILLQ